MKEVLQRILSDGEYDPDMETLWKLVGWLIEGDSYETEGEIRLHRNKKGYTCHITCRKPEVAFKVYEEMYIYDKRDKRECDFFRSTTYDGQMGISMPPQFIQWQSHGETKTNKGGMKGALLNTIRQANACSPFFKSTLDYYELGETGKELYE